MSRSTFIKGTIILTVATLLSKLFGSIFRVPLQNIAGDEVLGIFSLVYPVYMVALILSVAGIPTAISKLIAEQKTNGEEANIQPIFVTASILALSFGVLSFAFIYLFSSPIAYALGGSSTQLALIVVAATLLIAPYMAVYRGFFQGFGDMGPTAVSQVIEQIIRVIFILGIAYFLVRQNYSDDIVAGWIMIGSVIGAIASFLYLRMKYQHSSMKPTSKTTYTFQTFKRFSKRILILSIPIAIGSITMALINFIDSLTIPFGLRTFGIDTSEITYFYGIYGRGLALVQIATVFATSIVLPLIPLLTEKLANKDMLGTKATIEKTFLMSRMISWPAALGLLALSLPINLGLFSDLEGSSLIAILGLSSIFTSLTVLSTGILQGLNFAKQAAIIILAGVLLKAFSNVFLVQAFGLIGAAISTLLVYLILYSINSLAIYRKVSFTIINLNSMKILFSSIIMASIIGLPTLFIDFTEWSRVQALLYIFIAVLFGMTVYFILLLLWKVIEKEDLKRIPIVSHLMGIIFKERKKKMSKQKGIWITIILLILASSPGLYERWNAEAQNNTYEMVVPYEEIYNSTADGEQSVDEVLSQLKAAGLTTVSLNPTTLSSLEKQGIIRLYTGSEIAEMLFFSNEGNAFEMDEDNYYITVPENAYYRNFLLESLDLEEINIAGVPFYHIPENADITQNTMLGYDELILQQIKSNNLNYILRVPNDKSITHSHMEQLVDLNNSETNILFSGEEVVGYPDIERMNSWTAQLTEAGFHYYMIEFSHQRGFQTLARNTDYNILRLHSMNLNQKSLDESIHQAVRAVKERHIRSIFFHLQTGDPEESLENATAFVSGVNAQMPGHFALGSPEPFKQISESKWIQICVLLAGILFTYLSSRMMKSRMIQGLAILFMASLAGLYLTLDKLVFLQAFALIIAIITPIFAVLATSQSQTNTISKITRQYMKAIGISFIGIVIVVGLLNGNAFITGVEVFRGVKLIYVVPILFVGLYLFGRKALHLVMQTKILQAEVKYWHVLVGILIAAAFLYYVSRTGNAGIVSDLELVIRNKLEEWLYVRPRTKEFLIGFPLYLLALYMMNKQQIIGKVLLIPGVIGFLSMMNTFTHFHIPLHLSLLRSFYSLLFGYLIGILLIYLVKRFSPYLLKLFKTRWS
ncbi:DUF5693 family protein [Oceanobacillus bengalensis]|uniref:Polysaccharide biosynthesis protein n=1 Tax=Oceanobacillus bengalensis TaxID=1435466 RepID=A0A494Z059_9BACI|nr:DUF5693 family protein [Oceanobacillus bengalensis]RKQ15738.1 polysaccharide biosynthesis protein [Oceanobacillus bengalensis]